MPFVFSSGSESDAVDNNNDTIYDTFFWGCTLTKTRSSIKWDQTDATDNETHSLTLKQAVLGLEAKANERNIIQVETINYAKQRVHLPIVSLTLGHNDMCSLDMTFQSSGPVTFRLVEGSGPVHISAEHSIDYLESESEDDDDVDDDVSSIRKSIRPQPLKQEQQQQQKKMTSGTTSIAIVNKVAAATAAEQLGAPVITFDSLVTSSSPIGQTKPRASRRSLEPAAAAAAAAAAGGARARPTDKTAPTAKPRASRAKKSPAVAKPKRMVETGAKAKVKAVRKPANKVTAAAAAAGTKKSKATATSKTGSRAAAGKKLKSIDDDLDSQLLDPIGPRKTVATRRRSWAPASGTDLNL